MIKYFFIFTIMAVVLVSCSNETKEETAASLTVTEINAKASEFVGKSVTLSGTVVHVCRHGGKRMFMIGEKPEERFKITASPAFGTFDVKLEGSDVLVTGLVEEQRVDEAFLNSWEEEMNAGTKPEVGHQGHAQTEHQPDQESNSGTQVNALRKQLQESGKEYLSFYSIKCESVKEL